MQRRRIARQSTARSRPLGDQQQAGGLFALGLDEILVAIDPGNRRDRAVRPRRQHRRAPSAQARRETRAPRSRVRDRAGSTGTRARRISTTRASGSTSARRGMRRRVQCQCSHASRSKAQRRSSDVTIGRVVPDPGVSAKIRDRAGARDRPRSGAGCRSTGSRAATSALPLNTFHAESAERVAKQVPEAGRGDRRAAGRLDRRTADRR